MRHSMAHSGFRSCLYDFTYTGTKSILFAILGMLFFFDLPFCADYNPVTCERLAYAVLVIREAMHHGGHKWLDYDWLFRETGTLDRNMPWNSIHPGLQPVPGMRPCSPTMCNSTAAVTNIHWEWWIWVHHPQQHPNISVLHGMRGAVHIRGPAATGIYVHSASTHRTLPRTVANWLQGEGKAWVLPVHLMCPICPISVEIVAIARTLLHPVNWLFSLHAIFVCLCLSCIIDHTLWSLMSDIDVAFMIRISVTNIVMCIQLGLVCGWALSQLHTQYTRIIAATLCLN